ncbi:MAG: hypothetical protein DME80_07925, partial [Verrucomicrobia bacterium]
QIREAGCRAGLTLNPETAFDLVEPFLGTIDMLLVMTVHPGFGGQEFRADQMEKVRRAAAWNKSRERKIDIEVDGGINDRTARISIENGANVPGSQSKTAQTYSSPAPQFFTQKIMPMRFANCVANQRRQRASANLAPTTGSASRVVSAITSSVCVTRTTSSMVVLPWATRRQPSCRNVSIPSAIAHCFSSPPSRFCMTSLLNGSVMRQIS